MSSVGHAKWRPRLGACPEGDAVAFRVWAPLRKQVELVLNPGRPSSGRRSLTAGEDGVFSAVFADVSPGDLYAYALDGEGPFPDPASRSQPEGVHGPSAVVDPRRFQWTDQAWRGVALHDAVFYELHVGTFTPEGTFAGVTERLAYLADLGVTVVELMPLADFPGSRNWGYDGVSLFAPSRAYGSPDDLRRLVDTAHRLKLAVVLDVVYNHFGPDGAYATLFSPFYLSSRHLTPWGAAVNLDDEGSEGARAFFIENALHWLHEYHADGLRFDATHGLVDESPRHLVAELAAHARAALPDRHLLLVAEDERNLATIVRPAGQGGWGLDAVWADDFHHQARRLTAGDRDGYYADYAGTIADLASTIRQGWFYQGQWSAYLGARRGTESSGLPLDRMVVCLQNHDQVGNRPFGERLTHQIEPALFRALSALLLLVPETPLLFMGQEWAASTPFLFFTDHSPELGRLVTAGRREEFSRFAAFADPAIRMTIPDPQAVSTFERSRLVWDECGQPAHAGVLALYRALLTLRRTAAALRPDDDARQPRQEAIAVDDACLMLRRWHGDEMLLLIMSVRGTHRVDVGHLLPGAASAGWDVVLTTEEPRFRESERADATSPLIDQADGLAITFTVPSAVILRRA